MRTKFMGFLFSALLLAIVLTFSGFSFSSTTAHAAAAQQSHASIVDKSATAALSCPPTIRTGSTGWYVTALQTALNNLYLNYNNPLWFANSPKNFGPYTQDPSKPLRVDGDFGGHTFNAVWDYQSWNGLGTDGIVGPQTWTSLGFCV